MCAEKEFDMVSGKALEKRAPQYRNLVPKRNFWWAPWFSLCPIISAKKSS